MSTGTLLQLDPRNPGGHFQAGVYASYLPDMAAAAAAYSRAVELARQQGSWYWLAVAGSRLASAILSSPEHMQQVGRSRMPMQHIGSHRSCKTIAEQALHYDVCLPACRPSA